MLVSTLDPLSTAAETMSEGVEATEFEDGVLVGEYRVRQRAEVTSQACRRPFLKLCTASLLTMQDKSSMSSRAGRAQRSRDDRLPLEAP